MFQWLRDWFARKSVHATFIETSKAIRLAAMDHSHNVEVLRKRYEEKLTELGNIRRSVADLGDEVSKMSRQLEDVNTTSFARTAERQLDVSNRQLDRAHDRERALLERWEEHVSVLKEIIETLKGRLEVEVSQRIEAQRQRDTCRALLSERSVQRNIKPETPVQETAGEVQQIVAVGDEGSGSKPDDDTKTY